MPYITYTYDCYTYVYIYIQITYPMITNVHTVCGQIGKLHSRRARNRSKENTRLLDVCPRMIHHSDLATVASAHVCLNLDKSNKSRMRHEKIIETEQFLFPVALRNF